MRTSPRAREKLGTVLGKDSLTFPALSGSHISTTSDSLGPAAPLRRLSVSTALDSSSPLSSQLSSRAASEIASEIIVHAENMDLDAVTDGSRGTPSTTAEELMGETSLSISPSPDPPQSGPTLESPPSNMSDQSELSSIPPSVSSKATTPVDLDGMKDMVESSGHASPPRQLPRRSFAVKAKSSIPSNIDERLYADQCIRAAESSRLDPFSLHQEEYQMLRQHLTLPQVTTYLNIRNSILRLWLHNPRTPVSRIQAVGCAGARWFDVASICFDWLVRKGYINFGCVQFPPAESLTQQTKDTPKHRKTIVVIGAGMSGLGCARQLDNLGQQYADRFLENGELPPNIIVVEGRARVGGRVYSREFKTNSSTLLPGFNGERHTAEMGGMIITGFERGNPMNVILRGQLGLEYRALRSETTIYDSNGRPVDQHRDLLVEQLYNDCLDRVSVFKHRPQPAKLIRGNRDAIEHARDSGNDGSKTISQAEEAAAALPHAAPVSQQNVPERVNRVPISSDKLTGRVHTEPGIAATERAAAKAKTMGWPLRTNVAQDANIELTEAAADAKSTLGSVLDDAIGQYKSIVDLTAQDHRLINWHIANLEYSNATSLHNLSLGSWDIDAGNEWEGKHTMVVGGYQSVPRGLAKCPSPLDVRTKAPVEKIRYSPDNLSSKAVIECEDGSSVEADFVVSTIPLGILKQPGSLTFEPALPTWKTDVIERIGFGILNKVVLVYEKPFWDTERNIFGVLRDAQNRHSLTQSDYSPQRGRLFQWFNTTETTGLPCLVALMAGDAGFNTEHESNDMLIEEATSILRSVFGRTVPYPVEAVVTRWGSDRFARGSYSSAGPDMHPDDYNDMARPIGNLFFAGEHTIGTHPATVHGAYLSGLRAASEVFDALLGPIDVPSPLVLPRENSSSLKRKVEEQIDPEQARIDAYELAAWDYISAKIGQRPLPPARLVVNGYMLFNKKFYESAKKRCEEERAGKKKVGPNDVRVMTSKMWRATPDEERKPYDDEAIRLKAEHAAAVEAFNENSIRWDKDFVTSRAEYERDHPFAPIGAGAMSPGWNGKHRRASKMVDYAETDSNGSDPDI